MQFKQKFSSIFWFNQYILWTENKFKHYDIALQNFKLTKLNFFKTLSNQTAFPFSSLGVYVQYVQWSV